MGCLPGGADGPLVLFLAHMGRSFGENATIGSELMCSLVDVSLSKTNLFVMLRNAILITHVCIGKCTDGVAKLITKTDFAGLKAKKYENVIMEAENFLQKAWTHVESSFFEKPMVYKIFAMAAMRVVLMIFKKEKFGRENQKYTMTEIENMFMQDITRGSMDAPTASPSSTSATPQPQGKDVDKAISLQESSDCMFLAKKQLGLEPHSHYTVKDQPSRVWTLDAVGSDHVILVHYPLLEPSKKLSMTFKGDDIISKLKATKSKPPTLFDDTDLAQLFPNPQSQEISKCKVFQALLEVYNAEDLDEHQILVQKSPKLAVFAKKDIKAKGIKLIPCPESLSSIVLKQPPVNSKYSQCKFDNQVWYLLPTKPLKFPKETDQDQSVKGIFAPFWTCMAKDDEGTLEEKVMTFSTSQGPIEIHILVNKDAIAAHQQLALKGAKLEGAQDPSGEPSKKKAKSSK